MITISAFGSLSGIAVQKIRLENTSHCVELLTYGAAWHNYSVKKDESWINCIIAPKDFKGYLEPLSGNYQFGASIGPYGNRLNPEGSVVKELGIALETNDQGTHLHGESHGFSKKIWSIASYLDGVEPELQLSLEIDEINGQLPARKSVVANFKLKADGRFSIHYSVTASAPTFINMTNHAYFNLGGTISEHSFWMDADRWYENQKNKLPTGKVKAIRSNHDFTNEQQIGSVLDSGELDACFHLNTPSQDFQCHLKNQKNRLMLSATSNQPALVVFIPKKLNCEANLYGVPSINFPYPGICLEFQCPPDAPNHKHFPETLLETEKIYSWKSTFLLNTY